MKIKLDKYINNVYFFIPIAGYFTLFLILIEAFTYPGFLSKYILISSENYSIAFMIISIIIVYLTKNNKRNSITNSLFSLNYILIPVFLLTYFILYLEEQNNYPNFVFSSYHIHIEQIKLSLLFVFGLLILDIFQKYKSQIIDQVESIFKSQTRLNKSLNYILFLIVSIFFISNILSVTDLFIENYLTIISNPTMSYEEKQELKIPLYKYMMFIKANTRSDSKILIPPQQSPWLTIGNAGIVRYFLYPRKILVGEYDTNDFESTDFILLTKGSWHTNDKFMYGWPRENIYNVKITFYNLESEVSTLSTTTDYIFKPNSEISNKWGLIEVLQ